MLYLILGGAGFIGSHIIDALHYCGHNIRVFDRKNLDKRNIAGLLDRLEIVEGDFLNEEDVSHALTDVDVAIHLIGTTLPKSSNDNPIYDIESNVCGTLRFLKLARDKGVRKIVFASSGGTVYGLPRILPIPESHRTEPICSYGITKLIIEKYLHLYHHLYGLDYTVLRIANPYGTRQDPTSGQGVISTFLWRIFRGERIEIWGDGSVGRDYLYISDLVKAFTKVTECDTPSKVYNIGSGQVHTLREVLDVIRAVTGNAPIVTYKSIRKLDVPVNYLDASRARSELGWEAEVGLEEGIARTWEGLKASNG